MAFRDDNDALRAQIETLQHELRELQARHAQQLAGEQGKQQALEAKIAELEARRKRVEQQPPAAARKGTIWLMVIGAVVVVAVTAVVALVIIRGAPPASEPVQTARRAGSSGAAADAAQTKPPAVASGEDPLAALAARLIKEPGQVSSGTGLSLDHAAVALAFARDGRRADAIRFLDHALAWATRSQREPAVHLGVVSCVASELGDKARQDAALSKAAALFATGSLSYKDELSARVQAAEYCLGLELEAQIAPILAAAMAPAAKLDDLDLLLRLAALHAKSRDVAGLNQTAKLLFAKRDGATVRAAVGVHLWRLGEKRRGLRLVEQAAARNPTAVDVAGVVRALAIVGKTDRARAMLPKAVERVRADQLFAHEATQARQLLASACAVLGELERGRALASDWPQALVDAERWDEVIRNPSSPWLPVVIHLREAGQYDQALKRTALGNKNQLPAALAASYKIIAARRRHLNAPPAAKP